ncbi:MAG: hypothetical protein DHS20C07_19230 [Methyloligella sp.]|nr:MAG: hypothetical protein DHS20C07_19230 [Methyloligella sp.]
MAIESLKHETPEDNVNLLSEIAKVYTSLEKLHSLGAHLWPEDEDALLLCMDRLFIAALKVEIKTPEDCLAMTAISSPLIDEKSEEPGLYEQAHSKITDFALQHINVEEQEATLTI